MSERGRPRNQRGSTLAEVPLAFLWVFTAMFGLTESARLMLAYTTLSDAARAGTRYAIVHGSYRTGSGIDGPSGPGKTANVVTVVKQITSAAGLSSSKVTVDDTDTTMYPDGTNNIGARVKVKVSYPFTSVLSLIVPFSVTIGSTSEGTICY
jgi:hypothetical protein